MDLEAVEVAVRRLALALAGQILEQHLNADSSDDVGPELSCACGRPAVYQGRRDKQFESVLGPLTLKRAYYYCACCQQGFCPRDRSLGLVGSSLSPALQRMVGLVGAMVSFEEGSELLQELAGVDVPSKHVERAAESIGREIIEDERRAFAPPPGSKIPPTLYLGMDGTGIPMRKSELQGRAGKQPDGSAKTREVKLCSVWSAESRDEEGLPVRDIGSVTYSAAIESVATKDTADQLSDFAHRVERESSRRDFQQASRRVILGDGAPWIWNLAGEMFPGAIQIVDRFHVKEHLSQLAHTLWSSVPQAKSWAQKRHAQLDAGKLDPLLRALKNQMHKHPDVSKCIEYIQHNRSRMQYAQFRSQGLCTSTAVVESGCKTVIGKRLKQGGMHWTVLGANAIIALRCAKLSHRLEDFWERRALKKAA